jgi:hypothetical protein
VYLGGISIRGRGEDQDLHIPVMGACGEAAHPLDLRCRPCGHALGTPLATWLGFRMAVGHGTAMDSDLERYQVIDSLDLDMDTWT